MRETFGGAPPLDLVRTRTAPFFGFLRGNPSQAPGAATAKTLKAQEVGILDSKKRDDAANGMTIGHVHRGRGGMV